MRAMVIGMLLLALGATSAAAQKGAFGLGEDLRLEGVVDPSATAKAQALGTIKIRAAKAVRKFAVLRAQTSRTQGMSLFNRSSLHPEQLLLRGNAAMLDTFRTAAAGTRLRMLGRYTGDDYILAEVTVVDVSATPPATGQPR
jgi:hypothetical protein